MKLNRIVLWVKIIVASIIIAIVVSVSDLRINGVRFGLENLLILFAGLVMGVWVVGLRGGDY